MNPCTYLTTVEIVNNKIGSEELCLLLSLCVVPLPLFAFTSLFDTIYYYSLSSTNEYRKTHKGKHINL